MDIITDDNFFIDEPIKLRNNFFNKDNSPLQMVDLLAAKNKLHHDHTNYNKRPTSLVMLLKFCANKHPPSNAMRIKVDELLDRVLFVDFNRQQLIETLRRPEYRLNSIEHVIQLLRKILAKFNQNDRAAADWLFVILDAYFVELATTDEASDLLEQISAHVNLKCALLRETENTKCLLKSIVATETTKKDASNDNGNTGPANKVKIQQRHKKRPRYCIEHIEF